MHASVVRPFVVKVVKPVTLGVLAATLFLISPCTSASPQDPIKEQLVGTWVLVAVTSEGPEGVKGEPFGPSPKGHNHVFERRTFLAAAIAGRDSQDCGQRSRQGRSRGSAFATTEAATSRAVRDRHAKC
jgi:hypothetical protein